MDFQQAKHPGHGCRVTGCGSPFFSAPIEFILDLSLCSSGSMALKRVRNNGRLWSAMITTASDYDAFRCERRKALMKSSPDMSRKLLAMYAMLECKRAPCWLSLIQVQLAAWLHDCNPSTHSSDVRR